MPQTPPPSRRREQRYAVQLPLTLKVGKRTIALVTEDVSHAGLFLRTDEPLELRQLVQVELGLPPDGAPLSVSGMLVHAIPALGLPALAGDRGPGVGVQFYAMGRQAQKRWDGFIAWVKNNFPEAAEHSTVPVHADVAVASRRRNPRQVTALRVYVRALKDLERLDRRDVARGAMFLLTDAALRVGDEVGLALVHPVNADVFELSARVERCVHEHGIAGVGVSFVDLDDDRRERFREFVYDAIAPLFDDEEIVEEPRSRR